MAVPNTLQRTVAAFQTQYDTATKADISAFEKALSHISNDPSKTVDIETLNTDLAPIMGRIKSTINNGNSKQDLRLTALGWKFGDLIRSNAFKSNAEAANWLERNLGPQPEKKDKKP